MQLILSLQIEEYCMEDNKHNNRIAALSFMLEYLHLNTNYEDQAEKGEYLTLTLVY